MLFQTSFGIPAEGVYTGLIGVLLIIIFLQFVAILMMARRNIRLVDDNRQVTSDSISGFKDVINALNAIREQLQIGDNTIMGKVDDTSRKVHDKLVETQREILAHLQYLRDKAR